jgi:peroxiredoxin
MAEKNLSELLQQTTEDSRMMDASLGARLQMVADTVRQLRPDFTAVVDRMVARLEANQVGQNAPQVGEPMPEFILPDQDGTLVRLGALLEQGPVVISFNRGHWCPYCQLNTDGLAEIADDIRKLGGDIIAISPEMQQFGAALREYADAPFPVLTDLDNGYALQLNLVFWVGDEKREAMTQSGIDIQPYNGNDTWTLPVPATFVVGRDGLVKARYIDPDYRRRMELDAIVEAVAAESASEFARRRRTAS